MKTNDEEMKMKLMIMIMSVMKIMKESEIMK